MVRSHRWHFGLPGVLGSEGRPRCGGSGVESRGENNLSILLPGILAYSSSPYYTLRASQGKLITFFSTLDPDHLIFAGRL